MSVAVTNKFSARLERIVPAVKRAAHHPMFSGPAEDTVQNMLVGIMEKGVEHPEIYDQEDGYLIKTGMQAAQNVTAHERVITRRSVEIFSSEDTTDEDDQSDWMSVITLSPSPEDEVTQKDAIDALLSIADSLGENSKEIFNLLFLGYKQSEISQEMNLSTSEISRLVQKIKWKAKRLEIF